MITAEVTVNAAIEKVWNIWNNASDIREWNLPFDNWRCPVVEIEPRQGGKFLFRMESQDGNDGFDHAGQYDKFIPNNLIEYTGTDGRKSIIKFTSNQDGSTMISETFEPNKENSVEMQQDFCQQVLNRFKKHAEKMTR